MAHYCHGMTGRNVWVEYLIQNFNLLRDIVGLDKSVFVVDGENHRFTDVCLSGYS